MLGMEARLRNRQTELRRFLNQYCPDLAKPARRFFRQAITGILLSGSLIMARWLRFISDRCGHRFWRHKRLLNQIHRGHWDQPTVLRTYQRQWGQKVQPDTPLIVDLSDLPRPRARKLKYLSLVRDGSEDKLVSGYWCVEIYAAWGKRRLTPLCLHPYSIDDPGTHSENAMILRCVEQVFEATEGRGVLVMDRGADRQELLVRWIERHRHFVVCLKGDRHLLLPSGVRIETHQLAEHLLNQAGGQRTVWCEVRLPQLPDQPLWLVAKILPGRDRPLMLLTTLHVENLASAKRVLQYYRGRWSCEEAVRFLKSELGIEQIGLRTYESFSRLLLLAMLAMGWLSWLELLQPRLIQWLCDKHPGQRKIKFAYYRLLRWLQDQLSPIRHARWPPVV
jgi:hypothetical protein